LSKKNDKKPYLPTRYFIFRYIAPEEEPVLKNKNYIKSNKDFVNKKTLGV